MASEDAQINLHILTPSLPAGPLILSNLPAATTVAQLKDKICAALPFQPPPANQRLIYLGRPLRQDDDTLLTVFGAEKLQISDKQTIHMVVRRPEGRPVSPDLLRVTPSPASMSAPTSTSTSASIPTSAPTSTQAATTPRNPFTPSPAPPNLTPYQAAQLQASQHQAMSQWIQTIHRQAHANMPPHQIVQHHHPMATMSYTQGMPPSVALTPQQMLAEAEAHLHAMTRALQRPATGQPPIGLGLSNPASGRVSPSVSDAQNLHPQGPPIMPPVWSGVLPPQSGAPPAPYVRLGPSGTPPASSVRLGQAPPTVAPPLRPGQPVAPPSSQPLLYRASSRVATPDLANRTYSRSSSSTSLRRPPSTAPNPNSEVYILWSPDGPHSLVINSTPDPSAPRVPSPAIPTFCLPRQHSHQSLHSVPRPTPTQSPPPPAHQPPNQDAVAVAAAAAALNPNNPDPAQRRRHRRHRNRAAAADAQANNLWHHIWTIVRLAVFFWLFGLPAGFWSRVAVGGLVGVFGLYNAGVLDGPADRMWATVRTHVDSLLPRPERRLQQEHRQEPGTGDLDPARMAARLVAQRNLDNSRWIINTIRRCERIALLFVASLYPGVAERHIANIEREEREAQRLREEAARAEEEAHAEAAREAVVEEVVREVVGAAVDAAVEDVGGGEEEAGWVIDM